MAAPTVVGVSTTATWPGSAGLPFNVDWPGAASGRLVIVPIFARTSATTIALISGYTLKSTDNATTTNATGEIQAKIAGGSESAPSVTSGIADTQPTGAIAIVIDGWSGDLADVVVTQDVGASSNPLCPAGSAPADDCLVLRGAFVADDNLANSGLTLVFNELTLQGSDASMGWWSETANTGAVGTASLPLTAGSDAWMSFTIVIPPAAGGSDVTGSASAAFAFGAPASGVRTVLGAAARALTLDAPVVGLRTVHGFSTTSFAFGASAAGRRAVLGSATLALTFAAPATGTAEGTSTGSASTAFTFAAPATGQRTAVGSASTGFAFSATAAGRRTVTGSATTAWLFSAAATDGQGSTPSTPTLTATSTQPTLTASHTLAVLIASS